MIPQAAAWYPWSAVNTGSLPMIAYPQSSALAAIHNP